MRRYIFLLLSVFSSLNAMESNGQLSLCGYYCSGDKGLCNNFSSMPKEIQLHIVTKAISSVPNLWIKEDLFRYNPVAINPFAVSSDDSLLLTAKSNVSLWNRVTGKLIFELPHNWVNVVCFSDDNSLILTVSLDKTVCVWNSVTGQLISNVKHDELLETACLSNDNSLILTATYGSACLWNSQTGQLVFKLQYKSDWVTSACFNQDGSLILIGSDNNTAYLWDKETVTLIRSLRHDGYVKAAGFSKDGSLILTSSNDYKANNYTVRIWNRLTGALIFNLKHNKWVNTACFSKDGSLILTSSDDNVARLWDTVTGQLVYSLNHAHSVSRAFFICQDRKIVTASHDTVHTWSQYTSWKPDQLLLVELLFTWLRVEKPDKKSHSIETFLASTKMNRCLDINQLRTVWNTLPLTVQCTLWNNIRHIIQTYGKYDAQIC